MIMRTILLRATARYPRWVPQKVRRRVALSDMRDRVIATLREWRRRSRDRNQLASFDDRMLRDIGLTRADACREINKPFWRR
jgi:uncharacterized protein YjiS (DUF1127 family)